jgi:hypothetical protein
MGKDRKARSAARANRHNQMVAAAKRDARQRELAEDDAANGSDSEPDMQGPARRDSRRVPERRDSRESAAPSGDRKHNDTPREERKEKPQPEKDPMFFEPDPSGTLRANGVPSATCVTIDFWPVAHQLAALARIYPGLGVRATSTAPMAHGVLAKERKTLEPQAFRMASKNMPDTSCIHDVGGAPDRVATYGIRAWSTVPRVIPGYDDARQAKYAGYSEHCNHLGHVCRCKTFHAAVFTHSAYYMSADEVAATLDHTTTGLGYAIVHDFPQPYGTLNSEATYSCAVDQAGVVTVHMQPKGNSAPYTHKLPRWMFDGQENTSDGRSIASNMVGECGTTRLYSLIVCKVKAPEREDIPFSSWTPTVGRFVPIMPPAKVRAADPGVCAFGFGRWLALANVQGSRLVHPDLIELATVRLTGIEKTRTRYQTARLALMGLATKLASEGKIAQVTTSQQALDALAFAWGDADGAEATFYDRMLDLRQHVEDSNAKVAALFGPASRPWNLFWMALIAIFAILQVSRASRRRTFSALREPIRIMALALGTRQGVIQRLQDLTSLLDRDSDDAAARASGTAYGMQAGRGLVDWLVIPWGVVTHAISAAADQAVTAIRGFSPIAAHAAERAWEALDNATPASALRGLWAPLTPPSPPPRRRPDPAIVRARHVLANPVFHGDVPDTGVVATRRCETTVSPAATRPGTTLKPVILSDNTARRIASALEQPGAVRLGPTFEAPPTVFATTPANEVVGFTHRLMKLSTHPDPLSWLRYEVRCNGWRELVMGPDGATDPLTSEEWLANRPPAQRRLFETGLQAIQEGETAGWNARGAMVKVEKGKPSEDGEGAVSGEKPRMVVSSTPVLNALVGPPVAACYRRVGESCAQPPLIQASTMSAKDLGRAITNFKLSDPGCISITADQSAFDAHRHKASLAHEHRQYRSSLSIREAAPGLPLKDVFKKIRRNSGFSSAGHQFSFTSALASGLPTTSVGNTAECLQLNMYCVCEENALYYGRECPGPAWDPSTSEYGGQKCVKLDAMPATPARVRLLRRLRLPLCTDGLTKLDPKRYLCVASGDDTNVSTSYAISRVVRLMLTLGYEMKLVRNADWRHDRFCQRIVSEAVDEDGEHMQFVPDPRRLMGRLGWGVKVRAEDVAAPAAYMAAVAHGTREYLDYHPQLATLFPTEPIDGPRTQFAPSDHACAVVGLTADPEIQVPSVSGPSTSWEAPFSVLDAGPLLDTVVSPLIEESLRLTPAGLGLTMLELKNRADVDRSSFMAGLLFHVVMAIWAHQMPESLYSRIFLHSVVNGIVHRHSYASFATATVATMCAMAITPDSVGVTVRATLRSGAAFLRGLPALFQ